jgi:GntR family transcriptional regulator, transcriptional repressor for pyruvate dehydrogenase complex
VSVDKSPIPAEAARPLMTVGQLTLREQQTRTVKASERVAQDIVREIVERGLHTGDHLHLEAAMVETYGVSRASVREALRLLEVQGLISLKPGPGGGPVVGSVEPARLARTVALYLHLSGATYNDVMRTQVLLEATCAELAAQHPDSEPVMAPWTRPIVPGDLPSYRDATTGFHGAVYRLTANPVLSLLTQAVTHIVTQHVITTMDPVELRQAIIDGHVTMASVIGRGDADEAHRLMAQHFQQQHDLLRARFPARLDDSVQWR